MNLSIGIVGLPNVGKSTLFNTLTNRSVPAENYPFCTIDPNIGVVEVPDERLDKINALVKPMKLVKPVIEFYDIAGLVKGAHEGEGLGNKFLSQIKNTDAIVHVIRCFTDKQILHVADQIDPKSDMEVINLELILKDLELLESLVNKLQTDAKRDPLLTKSADYFAALKKHLEQGKLASSFARSSEKDVQASREQLQLITDKPVIYLLNISQDNISDAEKNKILQDLALEEAKVVFINIKREYELSLLSAAEKIEFEAELGLKFQAVDNLIRAAYQTLGLISFFTAGEKEVRGWTVGNGSTIAQAAGKIHSDFEAKFIAADVVSYQDFIAAGGWNTAKTSGKVRLEGKSYLVKDADVVIIRHGA